MQAYADQVAAIKADYAGRIATAAETSRDGRDEAFVDCLFDVCGIQLRAMSLADYCALVAVKNAHVTQVVRPQDEGALLKFWCLHDAVFLWRLSVGYQPDVQRREAFISLLRPLPLSKIHEGIGEYLRETFASAPRGPTKPTSEDPLKVSFAAVLTHRLASAYGWSRDTIRAAPLKEVFQQLRLIRAEERMKEGKSPPMVADETDRLWAEMMAKIDALNTAAA